MTSGRINETPDEQLAGSGYRGDAPQSDSELISVLDLVRPLRRHWKRVLAITVAAGGIAAVASLFVPNSYTAATTFIAEAPSQALVPQALSGLAVQFGLSLPAEASQSPRFYSQVVESRELTESLLRSRYPHINRKTAIVDSVPLLQIMAVAGENALDSMERGTKMLRDRIKTRVDNMTNVVEVTARAPTPALAAAIANRVVESLNDFNSRKRRTMAKERRRFAEERLVDAERDLGNAEGATRAFYERNRSWQQSPQLVFEEGRLRRQLEVRQEIYLTLRREFESARIQEVNNTPVITVVDAAVPPQHPDPRRLLIVTIAMALGGILGCAWAFALEYRPYLRKQTSQ